MVMLSALDLQAAGKACDLVELVVALVVPESGSPRIDADVCWGHPSGCVEGGIDDEGWEVSTENFSRVVRRLPEWIEILRRAIRRGKPVNNDSYEKAF